MAHHTGVSRMSGFVVPPGYDKTLPTFVDALEVRLEEAVEGADTIRVRTQRNDSSPWTFIRRRTLCYATPAAFNGQSRVQINGTFFKNPL
jgi:hypothetical protein